MKDKKNIILLVVAIIIFIVSLIFLFWSFNQEDKNLNKLSTSNLDDEAVETKLVSESETSNTQDVENVVYADITLLTENERKINLSDFKNTSVMLLFWNPENEDSVTVLKKVNDIYKKYDDKISFLMISDTKEIPENLKNEITMDIVYDLENEAKEKYNVTTLPTMIYIYNMYNDNTIMNAKSGVPSNDAIEANLDLLSDNF